MGIETSADHGGSESSFTSAIIAIEELAKIDPSVSVMCDVHNTLVNTIFRKYGTKEQQDKWLPQLAENKVNLALSTSCEILIDIAFSLALSACRNLLLDLTHSRCRLVPRKMVTIGLSTAPKCGSQMPMKLKFSSFLLM